MTTKEKLHRLVDVLAEGDADTAARVLEALVARTDPVALACALAPEDDEPVTDADRAAMAESRAQIDAGEGVPLEQLARELGL